jgi:ABC-type sugar transport system ATPase subunit
MDETVLLRVAGISKAFGGVLALRDMSLEVRVGECHALVGENGAGKTTLINILNGEVQLDSGFFELAGERIEQQSPSMSMHRGINVIHQDLALVGSLKVMENIFLSQLRGTRRGFRKGSAQLRRETRGLLDQLGCDIDPDALVEDLSTSKRQVVEIAKALSTNPKLLIMDEPTASLTMGETEKLFDIIRALKARGIAIVFVSHRLNEVMAIADRVTVIRDGAYIGTRDREATSVHEIVRMMVGREIELYSRLRGEGGESEVVLEVEGLSRRPHFHDVSFQARGGEILCFAGLVGVGRTELAQAVFGALPAERGVVKVRGKRVSIRSPRDAIRLGIGMLPEDRKSASSIDTMNVRENVSVAILPSISRFGFVRRREEAGIVEKFSRLLSIKMKGAEEPLTTLSGGNQQKVMLARWLATDARILIVDEPTQGVDVGAKSEIHRILRELAIQGVAVIVISSDLPEVLSISDRILVMRAGRIVGELGSSEATEEKIMLLATVGAAASA